MADVYPLLCSPVLKSKIWGGRKLEKLFGLQLPAGEKIGEAWMAADLPEGSSTILNGPKQGHSLAEVTRQWGEALIGPAWANKPTEGRFPLLIKFLDAQDDLSVQVHPDAEDCAQYFPGAYSKDESWLTLDSEPDGAILLGFEEEADLGDFDRLLKSNEVTRIIRSLSVEPGDFFRVAPGTVHALGKGVVILEIQEPSDTTFRIYDYGRLGDDGKPRDLHLDEARKVMRFGPNQLPQPEREQARRDWGLWEMLVDVPAYRIERIRPVSSLRWEVNNASVQVLMLTNGSLTLSAAGMSLPLLKGAVVILPAAVGEVTLSDVTEETEVVLAGAGRVPLLPE